MAYIFFLIKERKTYWDAIPYMGAVISIDENDAKIIHEKTYQLLKEKTSVEEQQKLIDGHPFCKSIYQNQNYFTQQLPFFQVKFLYIYSSYLFYKMGVPLYNALFLVVLISCILLFLTLYIWLKKYHGDPFSLLFSVVIFLCWFNVRTFEISSPDALAGLLLLLSVYFYVEKNNLKLTYLFLFLTALARPDCLFFLVCFFTISSFYLKIKPTLFSIIATLSGIATVLFISHIYQYNGWQMFYRSFVDLTVSPQTEAGEFSIDVYLNGMYNGIKQSMSHKSTFLFLFTLVFPFFILKKLSGAEKIIFYAVLTSVIVRFFVHPWLEERFVFIYIDIFIVVLLKHLDFSRFKNKNLVVAKTL
jgi:hypothetical protein